MMLNSYRRLNPSARRRLRILALVFLVICLVDAIGIIAHNPTPIRISPQTRTHHRERIFVASIHRNNEKILRSHWNAALLDFVRYYGPENIYVSMYESGSVDDTKAVLEELDVELSNLGVRRTIILDDIDQLEEVSRKPIKGEEGWIFTRRKEWQLRRIPYLASLRNKVMARLYDEVEAGRTYDTILWLNDVVFTNEDLATLLATREGEYDAVCSLDFKSTSPSYYDTFALRDSMGQPATPQVYPYFVSEESRTAMLQRRPVPVKSCWNGIVAFKAEPFYAEPHLRFRGVPDTLAMYRVEGSECCLIHADNVGHLEESKGVWLNPNVRVGYNPAAYAAHNPSSGSWPAPWPKWTGTWRHRWSRWLGWQTRSHQFGRMVRKINLWTRMMRNQGKDVPDVEPFCLINEMQVLYQAGWMHV